MQIMLNLMSNALKYTLKGSITIKLTSNVENDFIQIWIIDTGIGIKLED